MPQDTHTMDTEAEAHLHYRATKKALSARLVSWSNVSIRAPVPGAVVHQRRGSGYGSAAGGMK
jgi:hypothetical protein